MSLLEPLGVLTAAPALSRSSATCGDMKERGREGEGERRREGEKERGREGEGRV